MLIEREAVIGQRLSLGGDCEQPAGSESFSGRIPFALGPFPGELRDAFAERSTAGLRGRAVGLVEDGGFRGVEFCVDQCGEVSVTAPFA